MKRLREQDRKAFQEAIKILAKGMSRKKQKKFPGFLWKYTAYPKRGHLSANSEIIYGNAWTAYLEVPLSSKSRLFFYEFLKYANLVLNNFSNRTLRSSVQYNKFSVLNMWDMEEKEIEIDTKVLQNDEEENWERLKA